MNIGLDSGVTFQTKKRRRKGIRQERLNQKKRGSNLENILEGTGLGGWVEEGVGIKRTLAVLSTESYTELQSPYCSPETTITLYVN